MAKTKVRQNKGQHQEQPVSDEIRRAGERIGYEPATMCEVNVGDVEDRIGALRKPLSSTRVESLLRRIERSVGAPEWDLQVLGMCFEAKFRHAEATGGTVEVDAFEFDFFHAFVTAVRERIDLRDELGPYAAELRAAAGRQS